MNQDPITPRSWVLAPCRCRVGSFPVLWFDGSLKQALCKAAIQATTPGSSYAPKPQVEIENKGPRRGSERLGIAVYLFGRFKRPLCLFPRPSIVLLRSYTCLFLSKISPQHHGLRSSFPATLWDLLQCYVSPKAHRATSKALDAPSTEAADTIVYFDYS